MREGAVASEGKSVVSEGRSDRRGCGRSSEMEERDLGGKGVRRIGKSAWLIE
jgi:hypothetical protein